MDEIIIYKGTLNFVIKKQKLGGKFYRHDKFYWNSDVIAIKFYDRGFIYGCETRIHHHSLGG